MPSSRGSSRPRDQPRSPTLQTDSLLSEPFPKYICRVGVVISDPCANKGRAASCGGLRRQLHQVRNNVVMTRGLKSERLCNARSYARVWGQRVNQGAQKEAGRRV